MDPAFVGQYHSCSPEGLVTEVYSASLCVFPWVCEKESCSGCSSTCTWLWIDCRVSHHCSEAPGTLQVAKQEPQPQASRLIFPALSEKIILHDSVNARLQVELFKVLECLRVLAGPLRPDGNLEAPVNACL